MLKIAKLAFSVAALFSVAVHATENPSVIRFGSPLVGLGNKAVGYGNSYANAQIKGLFEEEFKKDNIKIEWNNYKGAGPAVNEAFANNQLDISWEGDLPAFIGKSKGLKTKLLLANGHTNIYLLIPKESSANSIADLKDKKVAIFKGTAVQLQVAKVLDKNGFTERDFKEINADTNTGSTALASGQVDALWGGSNAALSLTNKGIAKNIFSTRATSEIQGQGFILVNEEFEQKHPDLVQRIVNVLVKESAWASDENNRKALFDTWSKSGFPAEAFAFDNEGTSLKEAQSPLLDARFLSVTQKSIDKTKELKLLKSDLVLKDWIEPKYLNTALKNQNLENYWSQDKQ